MPIELSAPRRYLAIVQDPRGYPPRDAELDPAPPEGPAPPVIHSVVLEVDYDAMEILFAQRAQALEDLLEEITDRRASSAPGPTGHPYNLSDEHPVWALWGRWRGGGADLYEARIALANAIRTDLLDDEERSTCGDCRDDWATRVAPEADGAE